MDRSFGICSNRSKLGLILKRERNRFINLLASKASVSKASWKLTSSWFFIIFGFVVTNIYLDLFIIDVNCCIQTLVFDLNQ